MTGHALLRASTPWHGTPQGDGSALPAPPGYVLKLLRGDALPVPDPAPVPISAEPHQPAPHTQEAAA